MPRRPATITQADVARAIRAAKQAGAAGVEIRPDGIILIHLQITPVFSNGADTPIDQARSEIVL